MATIGQIAHLAQALGIDHNILQGFSNQHNGRLPTSIEELEQWGNAPDWAYGIRRRDQATGGWSPIGNGSRNPLRTDQMNAGENSRFANVNNSEDFGNMFSHVSDDAYQSAVDSGGGRAPAGLMRQAATTTPGAAAPSGGAATQSGTAQSGNVNTREGSRSWADIEAGLRAAGYGGPWDQTSMLAAFERSGGGQRSSTPAGTASSNPFGPLLDGMGQMNQATFDMQDRESRARIADAEERLRLARDEGARQQAQLDLNRAIQAHTQLSTDRLFNRNRYVDDRNFAEDRFNTDRDRADTRWDADRTRTDANFNTDRNRTDARFDTDRTRADTIFTSDRNRADNIFADDRTRTDANFTSDRNFGEDRFRNDQTRADDRNDRRQDFGEDTYRYDQDRSDDRGQYQQGQAQSLATSLLSAATNLRGPRDYDRYQTLMNQGRDVLQAVTGQRRSDVEGQAQAEGVVPVGVMDLLRQMGMPNLNLSAFDDPNQPTRTPFVATPDQVRGADPLRVDPTRGTDPTRVDPTRPVDPTRVDPTRPEDPARPQPPMDVSGMGARLNEAMATLRTDPTYQALDGEGRRAREAAVTANALGIDPVAARQVIDQLRANSASIGGLSSPQMIEHILGQVLSNPSAPNVSLEGTRQGGPAMVGPSVPTGAGGAGPSPAQGAADANPARQQMATTAFETQQRQRVPAVDNWSQSTSQRAQTSQSRQTPEMGPPPPMQGGPMPRQNNVVDEGMQPRQAPEMLPPPPMQGGPMQREPQWPTTPGPSPGPVQMPSTGPSPPMGPTATSLLAAAQPGTQPQPTAARPTVYQPWQVNPADWDRLSPGAQDRSRSYVEAQGHDADEYVYQMNRTRPRGTASAFNRTAYARPVGMM